MRNFLLQTQPSKQISHAKQLLFFKRVLQHVAIATQPTQHMSTNDKQVQAVRTYSGPKTIGEILREVIANDSSIINNNNTTSK